MDNLHSTHADTIIIGSGVAGLSAGLHLAERGIKPLILEADEQLIGGRLSETEQISVNGWNFRLEHGVHGIWSSYRNFQTMLARHNLRPVFVPAQEELWIYRDQAGTRTAAVGTAIRHSIFPAPLHYLQLFLRPSFLFTIDVRDWLKLFHTWSVLIMSLGIDPFGEEQPMDGQMLGTYIRKWSPALRAFFTGLARNGLSTHADEIPLAGFLAFLRFYTSLRRDSWSFSYLPDEGGTTIIEPLAEQVTRLGGMILKGRRVNQLQAGPAAWLVNCDGETFTTDSVILAVDSAAANKLFLNSFGPNELYFPRSLSNAIVRLWFDRSPKAGPEAGMFTGNFVMHNFFWLERIYAQYRKWHTATGGSAVEVHIYGPDETLAQPDALLLAQVISDFYRGYPELRGHLIYQHLQHNAAVHTLPSLGAPEKHPGVRSPWPGLYCAGDWVRDPLPSFFIERACGTGIKAANLVLQSRGLEPWPLVNYLPPEPLAGWIEKRMRRGRAHLKTKRKLQ